jgi:hypothetical protein
MTPFQILKEALVGKKIYVQKPEGCKWFHLFNKKFESEKIEATIVDLEDNDGDFQILIKTAINPEDDFEWVDIDLFKEITFVEDKPIF